MSSHGNIFFSPPKGSHGALLLSCRHNGYLVKGCAFLSFLGYQSKTNVNSWLSRHLNQLFLRNVHFCRSCTNSKTHVLKCGLLYMYKTDYSKHFLQPFEQFTTTVNLSRYLLHIKFEKMRQIMKCNI